MEMARVQVQETLFGDRRLEDADKLIHRGEGEGASPWPRSLLQRWEGRPVLRDALTTQPKDVKLVPWSRGRFIRSNQILSPAGSKEMGPGRGLWELRGVGTM